MATKTIDLLLTETVDSLGIVGDVVKVRSGYARNYLLPLGLAAEPSEEAIAALAQKRAEAERVARQDRERREQMIEKLSGLEMTLERSCNDQGHLYGSVTASDLAEVLAESGYGVRPRDVRLPQAIKRIDSYTVPLRLDQDLECEIKVWVVPDRDLDLGERDEMEFDNEGELIEKPRTPAGEAKGATAPEGAAASEGGGVDGGDGGDGGAASRS